MKKISLLLLLITVTLACNKSDESEPETDQIAIIRTDFGDMYVLLYDETPLHKENFLKLAKEGFYDSTTFHRVIEGFMIQGGDPNSKDDIPFNDGQGGPGYTIDAEFNSKFIHKKVLLRRHVWETNKTRIENPAVLSSTSFTVKFFQAFS